MEKGGEVLEEEGEKGWQLLGLNCCFTYFQ
jgi:hypothetical protein